jgi:5-(carboxyamino)imidazole ribonucleotide synthase
MLGIAAHALDVECTFLDPGPSPPAASTGTVIHNAFDDPRALRQLAALSDVVTYEFENVPVAALRELAAAVPVHPSPEALHHAQDRVREKQLFELLDIPRPDWQAVDGEEDLRRAAQTIGLPLVVKTRRFGYDGKGQALLKSLDDITTLLQTFEGRTLIAERYIPFDFEVSGIGARRADGRSVIYPLTRNEHRDGILRVSRAPAGTGRLAELAATYLSRLMTHLDYVGVLALEFFVAGNELLANEYAPRVHNSGHWTIEGADTSQFENHLRAVLDLPLGSTAMAGHAGMVNLIGAMPTSRDTLARAGMHLHDYGKAPRPGRKLGHVTLLDETAEGRDARLSRLDAMLNA